MPTWTGAVSTDWNTAGNWTSPSAVPTAATAAIFTGTPIRNCTTGAGGRACLTLNTTGYLGTLEIGSTTTGTLTVSGNVTIGNSVGHITGSAFLIMGTTSTLDVATGVTLPNLFVQNAVTITLTRTTNIINLRKETSNTTTIVPSSGTMSLVITNGSIQGFQGDLRINSNITVSINGSCTYSYTSTIQINLVLASGSTFTLLTNFLFVNGVVNTFNVSAGTFVPSTFSVSFTEGAGTTIVNMGSNSFYDLLTNGGTNGFCTMLSNINITRDFLLAGVQSYSGAFDITVGRNFGGGNISHNVGGRKISLTGTFSGTSTFSNCNLTLINLEVNCLANNFVFSGTATFTNNSFTYLATNTGTFTATSSNFVYSNCTINMNGSNNSFGTISNAGGAPKTLTLASNVTCVTFGATTNTDVINGAGFSLRISGNATLHNISGTATLRFIGSTTATFTSVINSTNSLFAISIEKTGGAILNIPSNFTYQGGGTITCTSLINHTGTLTLGNCTLNTSVASWNNITTNNNITVTINSLLTILGNLTLNGTTVFTGTSGWACANLLCSTINAIIVLQNSVTYTTTTSVNMLATAANPITMRSNTPTVLPRAIWTLNHTATQSIVYVNGQGVDSNAGQTVWTFGGAIITSLIPLNWNVGAKPSSYGFIGI